MRACGVSKSCWREAVRDLVIVCLAETACLHVCVKVYTVKTICEVVSNSKILWLCVCVCVCTSMGE